MAARDYWDTGFAGIIADKIFTPSLIERHKPTAHDNPIEQILEAMGSDKSIIIFPEGGRQTTDEPVAFKSGCIIWPRNGRRRELIPVLIDNLNRILPRAKCCRAAAWHVTFGRR